MEDLTDRQKELIAKYDDGSPGFFNETVENVVDIGKSHTSIKPDIPLDDVGEMSFSQQKRHDVHNTCGGGQIKTIYHKKNNKWVRTGRLCFRCMALWPDQDYFKVADNEPD